jgi:ankyrin repeat protein
MSQFSTDDTKYKEAKKNQDFFKECIEACMSNQLEKLKKLIDQYLIENPAVNPQMLIIGFQSEGRNLLHIASSSGYEEILNYILKQCSLISYDSSNELINIQDDRGHTPLINAVIAENNSMVKTLIKLGANVNLKNKDGNTSVHFAAGDGSVERLEILVEAKADITCTSSSGGPLHWAAGKGRAKAIKYLIDKGSNINCLNDGGLPPVLLAAVSGSDEGTSLLVEAGCDIGHIVSGNLTLLHICAENCLTSSVSAILRTETGRKSCQVETADGNLPIHLAAMSKDREIISLLIPFTDGLTSTDIDAIIEDGKRRLELWEKKNNRNKRKYY